ncbi:P-loop containing nucleoside triphosphate hydrolase protein, partial [Pluteus cervinus]
QMLWDDRRFLSRIINVVFDEGHCVSQWKEFREDYEQMGELRMRIFRNLHVPFYVASATLPVEVLQDIKHILHLHPTTKYFLRSTDRPDIQLHARHLVYPAGSYQDLDFLIPAGANKENPPPKFVVFIDDTKKCEDVAAYLQSKLGNADDVQNRITYFHAILSAVQREKVVRMLQEGDIWGLAASEAFGMGIDVRDLRIAVQYLATCNLTRLWQRYGRLVRGTDDDGVGILLYDQRDTIEWREAAIARSVKKREDEITKTLKKRKA